MIDFHAVTVAINTLTITPNIFVYTLVFNILVTTGWQLCNHLVRLGCSYALVEEIASYRKLAAFVHNNTSLPACIIKILQWSNRYFYVWQYFDDIDSISEKKKGTNDITPSGGNLVLQDLTYRCAWPSFTLPFSDEFQVLEYENY